jgi:hypothetical protein
MIVWRIGELTAWSLSVQALFKMRAASCANSLASTSSRRAIDLPDRVSLISVATCEGVEMAAKRIITTEHAVQAFALWVVAKQRHAEALLFEVQMNALLGLDDSGPLSDAIHDGAPTTRKAFDDALAREGLAVEPDTSMT